MTPYRDRPGQALVRPIVTDNDRLFRANPTWVKRLEPAAVGRLGDLKVPVLVMMGERDPTESNEAGRVVLELVPQAKGETFPKCGHLVPLDCGSEAARSLAGFLARR